MTKPDHPKALDMAQQAYTNPFSDDLENLYACYLDLTARHERFAFDCAEARAHLQGKIEELEAKHEALRKAAQRYVDALDNVCIGTTLNVLGEADAALRELLNQGETK